MIRVKLYQNKNEKNETVYNKWYPRVIVEETIGLEKLSLVEQRVVEQQAGLADGGVVGYQRALAQIGIRPLR